MAITGYNRRTLLGAIAATPIVIAAPAAAATEPSRHGAWLATYQQMYDRFQVLHEEVQSLDDGEAMFAELSKVEKTILTTPVRSAAEARDKLRFGMLVHKQGIPLDGDDAAELMTDVGRFLI